VKKGILTDLSVVVGFFLLTLLFTFPSVLHLRTSLIGYGRDFTQYVWNVWWFSFATRTLHVTPFHTDFIFFPLGQQMALQTVSLFHDLIFYCISGFSSLPLSWNILFYVSMLLPPAAMYVLARHLFKSRYAAIFAAVVFAFCPWMTLRATTSLYDASAMSAIPLFVLTLLRLREEGTRRWILCAGAAWAFAFYSTITVSVYLTIILIIWILWRIFNREEIRAILLQSLSVVLIFLVLASPLLYGITAQISDEGGGEVHWFKADEFSLDPGSLFIPASNHFFFRHIVRNPFMSGENMMEHTAFPGYSVLFLLLVAFIRRKNLGELRFFLWLAITFFVLALGPTLHLFGFTGKGILPSHSVGGAQVTIPLPYAIFYYLPVLKQLRWPGRFIGPMIFSLSILATWALCTFVLHEEMGKVKKLIIGGVFLVAVIFEYLPVPFPMTSAAIPAELSVIKEDKEDCSVLFIPLEFMSGFYKVGFHTGEDMYYQTYHQKRLVSGYQSRVPLGKLSSFANLQIIKTILLMQHLDQPQVPSNILDYEAELKKLPEMLIADEARKREVVTFLRIKYIVVMQPACLPHTAEYIEKLFGKSRIIESANIRIYRLDQEHYLITR